MNLSRSLGPALAVFALSAGLLAGPVSVRAQNASIQELLNRVDRLQRELSTLQSQVYRGNVPARAEPPLPGQTGEPGNPVVAARNAVRISQLENEIRNLTGRLERTDFQISQIQARLDKLVGDVDRRLAALEGGQTGQGGAAAGTGRPAAEPDGVDEPAAGAAPGATRLAPPQPPGTRGGVLGTIPGTMAVTEPRGPDPSTIPSAGPNPPPGAKQTAALPDGTPQEQYDYALSLMLRKQDFAAAETALKAFVEKHPKDDLSGNAHYWLGETFYVRKDYQQAAFAFAESFQKHPKGTKAPDSLLKLGMSLAQLDKRKEACTAYSRLLSTFPRASERLKGRVQREQRRSECK